jgi:hypothetical protein
MRIWLAGCGIEIEAKDWRELSTGGVHATGQAP